VLIGAADHVGAAADQRFERLRAALEVEDLDLQAFPGEEAAALGDGQRQISDERFAADGKLDRRFFQIGRPAFKGEGCA
jgi:hypothetical protein